jgi:hypothetical protein
VKDEASYLDGRERAPWTQRNARSIEKSEEGIFVV